MTEILSDKELDSLPPKLLIALGARCGRRIQPFFYLNQGQYLVEGSLRLAEDYAAGNDALTTTDFRRQDQSKYPPWPFAWQRRA